MMRTTKEMPALESWMVIPLVRHATEQDAPALLDYLRVIASEPQNNTSFRGDILSQTVEQQREMIHAHRTAANSVLFVADDGERIVGMVRCTGGDDSFTRHIADLSINIHPDYRGKGLGRALMRQAVEWARSNPMIHRVQLELMARNQAALHLYEQVGFQLEGVRHNSYFMSDEGDGHFIDTYIMAYLV